MGTWDGEGGFTGKEQRELLGVMVIFPISSRYELHRFKFSLELMEKHINNFFTVP